MRILETLVVVVALVSVSAPSAEAQNTPADFLNVLTITVNSGKSEQFQEFAQAVREAREQAGARNVLVGQTRFGGPTNQYLVVRAFDDWGELDAGPTVPDMLADAYGEDDAMELLAKGNEAIAVAANAVRRYRPEFSSNASSPPLGSRYANLVVTEIDPAQQDAYELFLRSVKTAEDNAGVRRIRRTTAMGSAFTYTTVWQTDTLAQRARVPGPVSLLREEYGEERAHALIEGAQKAVLSRTFSVLEMRQDLSDPTN